MIDPATLDWDDVRAFLEVARRGTLPEAARSLGLSAATVGRRLRRLESAVGASLFRRLPNRLELTPLGRDLAEAGTVMQQGASALASRAASWTRSSETPVRITATGSVSLFLASRANALARLAEAEGVGVTVLTTKDRLDVAGGDAEIALRMRRLPEAGALAARRLGRVAFSVYVLRDLWEISGRSETWEGFGAVGLPRTNRTPSQSRWLDETARQRGASTGLRFGDVALRHRAVQEGVGASLLPCFLGDADSTLVRLLEPPPELIEDVHLVLHEHGRKRRPVRAVADLLARLFGDGARHLCGAPIVGSARMDGEHVRSPHAACLEHSRVADRT